MQDLITALCRKLLATREPDQIRPTAEQLQHAISARLDRVREEAVALAIVDRMVDTDSLICQEAKESMHETRPSVE